MSADASSGFRERTLDFERVMTPDEALMWRIAADPWLDPSGSMVAPLDQPIDMDRFRAKMALGITHIPRLAERVRESANPLAPPVWEPDPEFSLDNHIIEVEVDAPGDDAALLTLTTRLHTTPLPPDRPPWIMYSVTGLADGRGALIARLHHAVADGIGALRMSEMYLDLERDPEPVESVDLDAFIADLLAATPPSEPSGDAMTDLVRKAVVGPLGLARAAAGELMLIGADPARAVRTGESAFDTLRTVMEQLAGDGAGSSSELWATRSGDRHLVTVEVALEPFRAAAKRRGGTLNDLFVAALAEAGLAYHEREGEATDALAMSFVRSTRSGAGAGGNAFVPIRISAPADVGADERFDVLRSAMAPPEPDDDNHGAPVSLEAVGQLAALLPISIVTRLGRDQGRRIDIVTSNIRGAPLPLYIGGAKVISTYPIGPLAGAACNATLISYDGKLDIGLMIDPAAIEDPEGFGELVQATFDRYVSEG